MGVWGCNPSEVQKQSPWSRGQRGEAPLKLKHFWLLDIQCIPHGIPYGIFSEIWKLKKSDFAVVFAKKKFKAAVYCKLMKSNESNMQK